MMLSADTLRLVKQRIAKHRGDRSFNEQNTKASLIVPILQSLGWDTNDSDEVHWEYKPKPRYNPVDFALMIQRTPYLFVEAKALRDPLTDDKLTAQIITYGSVAGVEWIVLTNGDEYRIYKVNAPVPIEEKLFRKIVISKESEADVITTLSLLSKADLQDRKIERLWTSSFVDRRVEAAIRDLMSPDDPKKPLLRAIRAITEGKIKESEIRASLRRARLHIDFPPVEVSTLPTEKVKRGRSLGGRKTAIVAQESREVPSGITILNLIAEGLIRPPAEIFCDYRKHHLSATIESDGRINLNGQMTDSPSTAGGLARKPFHKGDLKGRPYPQTNGWIFWKTVDPETREPVELDVLRRRFMERGKAQAQIFRRATDSR